MVSVASRTHIGIAWSCLAQAPSRLLGTAREVAPGLLLPPIALAPIGENLARNVL